MDGQRIRRRRAIARVTGLIGLALAVTGWLAASEPPRRDGPREAQTRPEYNRDKELIAPKGFRGWVFVGADLSPVYGAKLAESTHRERLRNEKPEAGSFHNIYINPEAYRTYLDTGKFPDPTLLIMEVFRSETKDKGGILTSGEFEGKRIGFEVAVKDKNRPGGGVPWAYYAFDLDAHARPTKPAPAMPVESCYQCHLKHASVDNVWVQFYPALRDPD